MCKNLARFIEVGGQLLQAFRLSEISSLRSAIVIAFSIDDLSVFVLFKCGIAKGGIVNEKTVMSDRRAHKASAMRHTVGDTGIVSHIAGQGALVIYLEGSCGVVIVVSR